jgi:amino acid transporter
MLSISAGIPLATFSFIGVELIAMTAFEARDRTQLRYPMKTIAYFIGIVYFVSVCGFVLDVKWCDLRLPDILDQSVNRTQTCTGNMAVFQRSIQLSPRENDITGKYQKEHPSSAVILIALLETGAVTWPRFVNVSLIFCVLSAANTALYVSSRTLFGLTRTIDPSRSRLHRILAKFGTTHDKTQVPAWALLASVLSFCWLPFIHLSKGHSIYEVEQILSAIGSVACLLVWASQCLAYIRYHRWLGQNIPHLQNGEENIRRLNRWGKNSAAQDSSLGAYFQPVWAWFGLISCLAIVFVFSTAIWWTGTVSKIPVIAAFIGVGHLDLF